MRALDIGLSALRAHQQTLTVLGNNVANASTPGYHRQRVNLTTRVPQQFGSIFIGAGVDAASITRLRNRAAEAALNRNQSALGGATFEDKLSRRLEGLLTPGDGSVHSQITNFFDRSELLANAPDEPTVRRAFLASASDLVHGLNTLDADLRALERETLADLQNETDILNGKLRDLSAVVREIETGRSAGAEPNDLLDRRDQLMLEIADWIPVSLQRRDNGLEDVIVGSGATLLPADPLQYEVIENEFGEVLFVIEDQTTPVLMSSGSIVSMLDAVNSTIPEVHEQISALANELVAQVDHLHATGLPQAGPYDILKSERPVSDVATQLERAELPFDIHSGNLYVTVTDLASGVRTTSQLAIDPQTDTLADVAAMLTGISGISSSVDAGTGLLTLAANTGFAVDFAGRVDNFPDRSNMTGTSVPQFHGQYTGERNEEWTVTFSGPGEIGVTPGLRAIITDGAGQEVKTLSVGEGYEAGTQLLIRDGVSLSLGRGSVAAADNVSGYILADSDETRLLSALGIGTLYSGSEPGQYRVREDLVANPDLTAFSRTGNPGDAGNAARIGNLRTLSLDGLNDRTAIETIADITGDSGLYVQQVQSRVTQLSALRERLEIDRDSVSGVDPNEELLMMMETERGFQAAARFIAVVDETLDEVLGIIR